MILPKEIAPYEVCIVIANTKDEQQVSLANEIYEKLYPYTQVSEEIKEQHIKNIIGHMQLNILLIHQQESLV